MKKNIKKIIPLLLALCMTLVLFTGCSSSSSGNAPASDPAQEEITVLVATDKGWVLDYVPEFEKETGIKVNLITMEYNDIATKFVVSAAGGVASYDVIEADPTAAGPWAQAGYLEPLDSYMAPIIDDIANPNMLTFDGKIYGMPWFQDAFFFLYNEDILKEAGIDAPPATWDDLVAQCQIIKDMGILEYPITMNLKQHEGEACLMMALWAGNGAEAFADGKASFNSPEAVGALQNVIDLNNAGFVAPGSFSSNPSMVATEICQGRSAYAMIWGALTSTVNDPETSTVIGSVKVGMIPSNGVSYTVDGSEALSIASNSSHKEAAWKFISGLTDKEYQKQLYLEQQVLPIYLSLYADKDMNAQNPFLEMFGKQLEHIVSRPTDAWWSEVSQIIQVQTISALNGEIDAQAALDTAVEQSNPLIG